MDDKKFGDVELMLTIQDEHLVKIADTLAKSGSVKVPHLNYDALLHMLRAYVPTRQWAALVALQDKKLVGCAVWHAQYCAGEQFVWIVYYWTDPKWDGLAGQMLQYVEAFARSHGIDTIRAEMTRGHRAVREKYGFYEISRIIEKKV